MDSGQFQPVWLQGWGIVCGSTSGDGATAEQLSRLSKRFPVVTAGIGC